ncbi:MAG: hypothetical protein AB2712_02225 [Candidatus Thiodiazotropha sp.]
MKRERQRNGLTALSMALLLIPCLALAKQKPYGAVMLSGDSLSDPGNAFILSAIHPKPPCDTPDETLMPNAPYARGGNQSGLGE